jgi:hypothetical protein
MPGIPAFWKPVWHVSVLLTAFLGKTKVKSNRVPCTRGKLPELSIKFAPRHLMDSSQAMLSGRLSGHAGCFPSYVKTAYPGANSTRLESSAYSSASRPLAPVVSVTSESRGE